MAGDFQADKPYDKSLCAGFQSFIHLFRKVKGDADSLVANGRQLATINTRIIAPLFSMKKDRRNSRILDTMGDKILVDSNR